jgi:LemA protein
MNLGKILFGMMLIFFAGLLFVGCAVKNGYDKAITLDESVKSAWAQVENQLQRRYELLPNLVETVKGVAGQEKDIFLGLAKSREAYFQAKDVGEKAKAALGYESALSRLLVLNEKYPELKSNESFLKLQDSVEGAENRLSVETKKYNDAVSTLNTFSRKFFGRFYASIAGVQQAEYFEVDDDARATPKIDFSGG